MNADSRPAPLARRVVPLARRIVLLGASNLTLGLPHAVAQLRQAFAEPLEIMSAHGHGRSYGIASRVLARELPGIRDCGLWNALDAAPELPTAALVCDVGNDIMYGVEAAQIAAWLERSVDRLLARGAQVVLLRMPVESVLRLPAWRFRLARAVLFPTRQIEFEGALDSVRALDQHMQALARARALELHTVASAHYGWDAIHLRASQRARAWSEILAPLLPAQASAAAPAPRGEERRALRRLRPHSRRMFGRLEQNIQPSVRLPDGSSISWY